MNKWLWISLSLAVVIVDQLSKYWIVHTLSPYEPYPLMPMLNFTLAFNTGVAFSFLSEGGNWSRWFFIGFSLSMSLILLVWLMKSIKHSMTQSLGISLILGGAIGNLYDRFFLGHVIDFIDVYYATHHWPIFNLADSAICVGAIILFFDLLKSEQNSAIYHKFKRDKV